MIGVALEHGPLGDRTVKWQYKTFHLTLEGYREVEYYDKTTDGWLNKLGQDGWELVKLEGWNSVRMTVIMKRPLRA